MIKLPKILCGLGASLLALTVGLSAREQFNPRHPYTHVLLISVDGLHAVDLTNYVAAHPSSTLAALSNQGLTYPNALTSAPSDSFPGLLAQVTGGTSKTHGVFYDVSYDRTLFGPGSNCQGLPGWQPAFDESIDNDKTSYTAGGTLGQPLTQINPANLPMALTNGSCVPVYPHDFIKVNTIFEVIRRHGGRTAWADKHPAYDIVNGPSGTGVQDLFTPEVNSNDSVTGQDATTGFHSIERNDLLKVNAVLNEIKGLDSTGKNQVGVPAIFGFNFQSVSVGQKLAKGNAKDPQDAGLIGGYADAVGKQPNNGLQLGLDFVDAQLGAIVAALKSAKIERDTLIIVSAKHGQSPINLALRQAVDDTPYTNAPGFAASADDDAGIIWLNPQQQWGDYLAAKNYILSQKTALGIVSLLDKDALTQLYQNPFTDNRTPDFIAITTHGLIYTGGSKLAEHGGFANDDRNVALLVSNSALAPRTINAPVETRQIAPTILLSLGLDADELKSVRVENTQPLPGFDRR
ncbi:alkaline phosphatase family protein [Methylocapsa acidiphila]|uniref:alkaline phosphatase family protein n=1 Tax=Methylocapsa acidiphila TaxID=133552 RepID=UPI0003F69CEC|nr:alkaline phosphatase family protein [Methylocapsa acidiphila]